MLCEITAHRRIFNDAPKIQEHLSTWITSVACSHTKSSYMCAVSKPECKASYKTGRPLKAHRAQAKPAAAAAPPAPVHRVGKKVKVSKAVMDKAKEQPLIAGISRMAPTAPVVQVGKPIKVPKMKPRSFKTVLSEID